MRPAFFETVATLVKNDLLNRELVCDWLWVAGPLDRVGPAAIRVREAAGVPIRTRISRRWPQDSGHPLFEGGHGVKLARQRNAHTQGGAPPIDEAALIDDSVQAPAIGDALQLVLATVLEGKPRAGD